MKKNKNYTVILAVALVLVGLIGITVWVGLSLRHYYLIYVNQALDGFSIAYVWPSVVSLIVLLLLPCTVLWRYRAAFLKYKYIP